MTAPTILIVEDNPITRSLLRVTLETEQFRVLDAEDGATALSLLDAECPALVLQNFVLPDMTGAELLQRIRRLHDARAMPVVLLTGLAPKAADFAEGGGFTAVLSKPVEPSRLVEVVRSLVAAAPLPEHATQLPPRRVLVVDDDAGNRRLLDARLRLVGYFPTVVASVEDALREARQNLPDVILGDVLMPGLDGYQLCLAVRRDPVLARVPIVLVSSAFTDDSDRKLAIQIGASDLVMRTPGLEQAIDAIEAAFAAGAPVPAATVPALDQEYADSLRRQIDRQMAHIQEIARRSSIQAAALSMVGALAQALANPREISAVLGDVLVHCLDAAGLSTGILYLREPDGALRVHCMSGIPEQVRVDAEAAFGYPALLEADAGGPVAFNDSHTGAAERGFLSRLKRRAALVVPFVIVGKHYGTLVLASDVHELGDPAWAMFARTLATQFGQAVALGRSLGDLAESDALFRNAVEASPNGMVLADAHGRIVMTNRQAERIFGYEAGELVGRPLEDLVPADRRAAHVGHRTSFMADSHARPMGAGRDLFGVHKSGRKVPVEIGLAPITRAGETYVIASVVDITERRRTEERIRWLSLAVDQGPTSVVMTDLTGKIEYVNAKFTEVTGYTLDEVRGENPRLLSSGTTPPDIYRDLWTTIVSGHPWHGEMLNRKKDGTTYWDSMWVYPIREGARSVTHFLALKDDITERKQAEHALRESERRARTLFETVNLIVLGLDAAGRVNYVNPFLLETMGYDSGELLGHEWFDFLPERDRSPMRAVFAELLGQERHLHHENPVQTKAGEVRLIAWNNTVLRDPAGGPAGTISIGEDITERNRSAQVQTATYRIAAAAQSAPGLQDLLAAVHEIVGMLMPARNFYIALYDETRDLIEYPYYVDEHDPPPAPHHPGRTITAHVLSTGEPLLSHQDVPGPDGALEWVGTSSVDWLGVPLKVGERAVGVLAVQSYTAGTRYTTREQEILQFVSTQVATAIERKRAEATLRANEERFRALVEHSGDAIALLDRDGKIQYASQSTTRILGRDPVEVIGKIAFDYIHADDVPEVQRAIAGLRNRPGAAAAVRARFRFVDDTWRAGEGTVTNRLHDPTVRAIVFNYRDVTDRHRLETQLQQAQKMEAVGRLAGGVAHDFNNVLTAIFGYTELLTEALPADSAMRGDLGEIRKAAQRAAGLTRQLLAFSRQQVLQPMVLNLNDTIENLDKMLYRLVGADVAMHSALAPDIGNVRADPGQIEQVVMNLVVNARDAMPVGGKLTIETANAELTGQYAEQHQPVIPGHYVMLAVSDTGTGITPEVKARLFEPFFTTKEKGKGTGLGLATVYGIVKQSGGYIWAYSEPGHGATFKIYLPRVDAPVDTAVQPPELKGTLAGTETILLAEDDELLRPLATSLLKKLGYVVLESQNAADALARAAAHPDPIHLLITDVVMPGASGRELARQLATTRPDTLVLFISGYTDDAIVRHGMLEAGLNYLQKPFTPAALARKVREILTHTP